MHTHGCYNTLKVFVQWMTTLSKFTTYGKSNVLHMLSAEQCSIVNKDEAGELIEQGLFNYIKVMKICSF